MIGRRIAQYRIVSKLGQGGMGEVYLAEDTQLERKVAIKFVSELLQDKPDIRKRLLREAKSAAALDHPFVCKVYETGETEGKLYIVMEYVEGENLQERLRSGRLSLDAALSAATEIAEALESAHNHGIVHRDLKPSNIMMTREGHVKVMDFGLAKRLLADEDENRTLHESSLLTQAGSAVGTVGYMSPEQVKGLALDARSDVFSFGILLYEIVTGINPFLRKGSLETAGAIVADAPPPVSKHCRAAPVLLERMLKKMLAKNSEQRYPSVHEVLVDLRELRQGASARTVVLTVAGKMGRPSWPAVAILAGVVGLAGVTWWVYESYFRSPQAALSFKARDWILLTDFENHTRDAVFEQSLQAAVTVGIQQSRYVNVFPNNRIRDTLRRMQKPQDGRLDEEIGSEIALREGLKGVLTFSISQVGSAYALSARLVDPLTRVAVLTETDRASGRDEVLGTLDGLVRKVRGSLGESLSEVQAQAVPLPRATTASLQALKTFAEGRRLKAKDENAAISLIQEAVALDPEFAIAHADLGVHYYIQGNATLGEEHFAKALIVLDRLTLREKLWIRSVVEDWRGNREGAIRNYETYLSQYPDDGNAWFRLGWASMISGQGEKAVEAFKKVLELDPEDSSAYVNLASSYISLNEDAEALKNYHRAFEIRPDHILGDFVNHEYGFLLVRMGELQKAEEIFRKMLADVDRKKARGHRSLALLLMYRGKYAQAAEELKEAALIHKAVGARLSEMRDRWLLACVHRATGNLKEVASELAAVRRIQSEINVSPEWLRYVGKYYARAGRLKEARQVLAEMVRRVGDRKVAVSVNRSDRETQAALELVKGEIALAAGSPAEGLESLKVSCRLYDDSYSLESLAHAQLIRGNPSEAESAYERIVEKRPLGGEAQEFYVLAHYELGKLREQRKDLAKSEDWYRRFLAIWREADPNLPGLADARSRLSRLVTQDSR